MKHIIDIKNMGLKENRVINHETQKIEFLSKRVIALSDSKAKYCKIRFDADITNAGGYLLINNQFDIPVNSVSIMEIKTPIDIQVKLVVSAESEVEIKEISFEELEEYEDLTEKCEKENDVLVITPNYPSGSNLYLCAFAHSRNREYKKAGVKFQVIAVSEYNFYETLYTIDGISVYRGTYESLKRMLASRRYKVTVTHFVDEHLYSIFDGYTYPNDQMIFICHGPETTYRFLEKKCGAYFEEPTESAGNKKIYDFRDSLIKKYAGKDNVEWVFVSDWLKDFSENYLGLKFKHARVISNVINEELFPYIEKQEEDRKKILILRKFDNIVVHAIDQSVRTILELAKREFFDDLSIEVYGDGNYYDELTEPLKEYPNVHLHRMFVPNDKIAELHKESGIFLCPSRHDTQGVAIGEAASSGMAVVGSRVTCLPYFMNENDFHTLADPENPVEMADIIERLYMNPKEFLRVSKGLSEYVRKICGKERTVEQEVSLIKEKLAKVESNGLVYVKKEAVENPVLTVVVPAYNVEKYLEKCIISMLKCENSCDMEILIVNDGSTDHTLEIAEQMQAISKGIVRIIDKENGGHGSTINAGLKEARGKYFRLIDGDDWVDSEALSKLIEILKTEETDLILTKGSYAYIEKSLYEPITNYESLIEGKEYQFDDLVYYGYGFKQQGPLLSTSNYKTEVLKKANFMITEKKPYVDMEFNSFGIQYVNTLKFYNLDIYRYLIGREGQTISREYWKRKYKDHAYIIHNIISTLATKEYSEKKRKYINKYILAPMVDSQVFMYDAVLEWGQLDEFLNTLKKYPEIYENAMLYIEKKQGNCQLILKKYKNYRGKQPIIIPGIRETLADDPLTVAEGVLAQPSKIKIRKIVKYILPYGVVRMFQMKRNK